MKTEAERWGLTPQTDKKPPSSQLEFGDTLEVKCTDAFEELDFDEAFIIDQPEVAYGVYSNKLFELLGIDYFNKEQRPEVIFAEQFYATKFYFKFKDLMKENNLKFLSEMSGKISKNGATTEESFKLGKPRNYHPK